MMMRDGPPTGPDPNVLGNVWREQLVKLYALFAISTLMFDHRETEDILRLAATTVPSLGECEVDGIYLVEDGRPARYAEDRPADPGLDEQVRGLSGRAGEIALDDGTWRWAFALGGPSAARGHLVVRSAHRPPQDDFFLLTALSQQTTAALANASVHRDHRAHTAQLEELNVQLSASVARLEQQTQVHNVLTTIAASGAGERGIATAVHGLTELPVVIEDRFGNLRVWVGPGEPDPYPKIAVDQREELLRQASAVAEPYRYRDRVVSLVRPRHEVLGVLALVDPRHTVSKHELFTLEYGTTVLALELAHQRSLAEVELRLHRELVDDLVDGTDDQSAYARADAVGHDLRGPHCVVVIQWLDQDEDAMVQAARRATSTLRLTSLVSRRPGSVVLLIHGPVDGTALHRALADRLGSTTGTVGIGGRCRRPSEFPRAYAEASRALEVRRRSRKPYGVTVFAQLGVYRILDTGGNRGELEEFVREWLGRLIDYDEQRNADFVRTLSHYLECGGNYDETATSLLIHRSTLRYRLGRIREITNLDLNDVDSRLNLHVATRAWQVLRGVE